VCFLRGKKAKDIVKMNIRDEKLEKLERRLERERRSERERKAFMARLKDRAWKGKDASTGGNEDSTRVTYSSGGDTR
jgi:hypothetical protein